MGYLLGHGNHSPVFVVGTGVAEVSRSEGTAYIGPNERISRAPTGFAYMLPPDVAWIDQTGTIHDPPVRAPCLPYLHAERLKMEAVQFPIAGGFQGTVLWVQC